MGTETDTNSSVPNHSVSGTIERLLAALKPWRELIALVVTLGTTLVVVLGYFATKTQLEELRCIAKEGVALARAETALRITFDEINHKSLRSDDLEAKAKSKKIGESEKQELKRIQTELKLLDDKRKNASARIDAAEKMFYESGCTKEKT